MTGICQTPQKGKRVNSKTTAQAPLRPVAENSEVLRRQVKGEITRDGQGPFRATKPPEKKPEGSGSKK